MEAGRPGSWDDYAIWTGSVIVREGLAYMFYTGTCQAKKGLVQRIGLAVSTDLVHWERDPGNPLLEVDTRWYEPQSAEQLEVQTWRDPYVVYSSYQSACCDRIKEVKKQAEREKIWPGSHERQGI